MGNSGVGLKEICEVLDTYKGRDKVGFFKIEELGNVMIFP